MEDPEAFLGRLKPIYIFKGLTDDQIVEVARELEIQRYSAGEVIFHERDEGQHFYIINAGQVKVLRQGYDRAPKLVASLVAGDFFGETALLYGRRRSATVEAATDVELLGLSKEQFDKLLRRFPNLKPNLMLSTESAEIYRRNPFNWLGENEVVYLIARRHRALLYQSLFAPIALGALLGLLAVWLAVTRDALWIGWVGGALELPFALWLVWNWVDWGNDFYIVTNERLVYIEKIVGIYDSRVEAPLSSILSVNVATSDSAQRALHMGDVVVRTFSGPITLKSVANPEVLEAAIEEHWYRTKTHTREGEVNQIKRIVREELERGSHAPVPRRKPPAPKPQPKPLSLLEQFARMVSFQVRFQEGDTVIYRKHWYMLFRDVWKPSLGLVLIVALAAAYLAGFLRAAIPLPAVMVVVPATFSLLAGWWLYEYEDWKNDIYMVTPDQIFDVNKKPLGAETRKSAPLANVLSLKYERPGLLGVLLNFGTVVATVAGTEFRFEGVFDPPGVQNDVYRRIETLKAKKEEGENTRRRQELADWVLAYHQVETESRPRPAAAKGSGPAGE
jgi:CRP-like cAMP-binding protein